MTLVAPASVSAAIASATAASSPDAAKRRSPLKPHASNSASSAEAVSPNAHMRNTTISWGPVRPAASRAAWMREAAERTMAGLDPAVRTVPSATSPVRDSVFGPSPAASTGTVRSGGQASFTRSRRT